MSKLNAAMREFLNVRHYATLATYAVLGEFEELLNNRKAGIEPLAKTYIYCRTM